MYGSTHFLILYISGLMLYCLTVIDPAVEAILHGSRTYGDQMLLLLVFPLVFFARSRLPHGGRCSICGVFYRCSEGMYW